MWVMLMIFTMCYILKFNPCYRHVLKNFSSLSSLLTHSTKYTVCGTTEHLEVVKNSKFLVRASHSATIEEALSFLKRVQDPKASHNCWAYKPSDGYERFSDDGEPAGTAGRPILNSIESEKVFDVIVVCTRYFGGIKLGTGGLVRAYGDSARNCLKLTSRVEIVKYSNLELRCKLSLIGSVYYLLNSIHRIQRLGEDYQNEDVLVKIRVPQSDFENLSEKIQSIGKGQIQIKILSA